MLLTLVGVAGLDANCKMSSSRSLSSSRSKSHLSKSSKLESTAELQSEVMVSAPEQFSWQVLSQTQVARFKALSPTELTNELSSVLSLSKHEEDLQQAAILDYYVSSFVFAQEKDFTDEQMSSFITIIHKLLGNIREKRTTLQDNLNELKSYFAGVGVSDHTCLKCFTPKVAATTISYIHTSLVQHYTLFEYVLQERQEDELIQTQLLVSLPPDSSTLSPPPLEESVTEDFYNRLVSTTAGSPSPTQLASPTTPSPPHSIQGTDTSPTGAIPSTLLLNLRPEDVKMMTEKLLEETVTPYQDEMLRKLVDRETNYKSKLDKLDKSLT